MRRAAAYVRAHGGLEGTRVFTRVWLAMVGQWSWDDLPALPPEMMWLPAWFPLNIYDWACWARQTVVPLTVVGALRLVRPLGFGLDELRTGAPAAPARTVADGVGDRSNGSTCSCAGTTGARRVGLRRAAVRRAMRVGRGAPGGRRQLGGIQPPWVYSILALYAVRGYRSTTRSSGPRWTGLEGFTVHEVGPDGPVRRLEACQSPVWDTALALIAPPRRRSRRRTTRSWPAPRRGSSARRSARQATGRCGCAGPRPAGGPSSSTTTATPTSTTPPRSSWRSSGMPSAGGRGGDRRGVDWSCRDAVPGRRLGRVRRRQHELAVRTAAVLRLRGRHRSALRRRHRPRRRDARRNSSGPERSGSALAPPAGAPGRRRRGFGRAGGRTARGSDAGAPTTSTASGPPCPRCAPPGVAAEDSASAERSTGWQAPERRRRVGRGPALVPGPGRLRGRGESTPSQTAWALLALIAAGERGPALAAASTG